MGADNTHYRRYFGADVSFVRAPSIEGVVVRILRDPSSEDPIGLKLTGG
jgi:hypothetical protein